MKRTWIKINNFYNKHELLMMFLISLSLSLLIPLVIIPSIILFFQ